MLVGDKVVAGKDDELRSRNGTCNQAGMGFLDHVFGAGNDKRRSLDG